MNNQESKNNQRSFELGTILSLTTHRMLNDLDKIQEALDFITDDQIMTHQIPRVLDEVTPFILSLYPDLAEVEVDDSINTKEKVEAFVNSQKEKFGDRLPLDKMSKSDGYTHVDPLKELFEIRSGRTK